MHAHTRVVTWPAVAADRREMRLSLSAARPAAAPGRADGERRKERECVGREELNCPTSEMDTGEKMARKNETRKKESSNIKVKDK